MTDYKIRLDMFEGPLDLLLYLIKKDELNIVDIPIMKITQQYLDYLNLMENLNLDIAGDFLVMAATLMQIKSRMLLPPDPAGLEMMEEDPRTELVRRLLEYKAFKEAAERFREFEAKRSGVFGRFGSEPDYPDDDLSFCDVSLFDLLTAFQKVLLAFPDEKPHEVLKDEFTVQDKIQDITERLKKETRIRFSKLFRAAKNKLEAITTFLALLELVRQKSVLIEQSSQFGEIDILRNDAEIIREN